MNSKYINHQLKCNNKKDIKHLSTDINPNLLSEIKNNKYLQGNKINLNINSIDIDILLDKTQNSIDEFITSLTNEKNMTKKSYKKIPYKSNGLHIKLNKLNNNINKNNTKKNYSTQKLFNYDRDITDIIATQRKFLAGNEEKYETMVNDISADKNIKIFRKKTDNDIMLNINKKAHINNEVDINNFGKQNTNKRAFSPLVNINNIKHINEEKIFSDKIINYKNIIGIYNKKNKLLIKENEKYKKEINRLNILLQNFEKENKRLNKKIREKANLNECTYDFNNMSVSNQFFSIMNKSHNIKNKELIVSLKKEIKYLKEQLNNYKINENKNIKNCIPMEHDINIDQIEKLKKENNDLGKKNISLIKELNNLKRNQNNFIENNILDKKNKSLSNQISYLKAKLKNYNNLQIYIKLYLENKNCIQSEKEEFFIRKIKEELDYIEQNPKSLRRSLQTNNNYFPGEINDDIYNTNK